MKPTPQHVPKVTGSVEIVREVVAELTTSVRGLAFRSENLKKWAEIASDKTTDGLLARGRYR